MKEFEKKEASNFHEACKTLNDINKSISKWESDYIEAKESFINRSKERRITLIKEKDDIMTDLNKLENDKNNIILYKQGWKESSELYEKMNICIKDEKNTFNALCELEDEPAQIENINEVHNMVHNE